MAEESPLPCSDTSPLSHKRRITLSPPPLEVKSSVLELVPAETQDTHSPPEQSPKKPKFCSQNLSITVDEGGITDEFPQLSENNKGEDFSEFEQLGNEQLDVNGWTKFSEFEMEEKNVGFDEFLGNNDGTSVLETESSCEIVGFEKKAKNFDGLLQELGKSEDSTSSLKIEWEKMNEGFEGKEVNDEFLEIKDEIGVLERENHCEIEKKGKNFNGFLPKSGKSKDSSSSLKIEVIDGTAVLDVSMLEGKRNIRKGKKDNSRKTGVVAGASNGGRRKSIYSRKDLEILKFVNVKGQKKFWQKIYNGFSATMKKEYDEVGCFKHHKRNCSNGGVAGESCSGIVSCDAEMINTSNLTCDGEDGDGLVEEWSENEESDDEYESIYRPAFKVEGEPDFESGPPEDGLEYLRRVRWEAKQIPKVKTAKLDNVKLKDQSFYMPEIPDIEDCPPHLIPLRQWEDEFISDFSELRLALSRLENTSDAVADDSETVIFACHERKSHPNGNLASLKLTPGAPTLSTVLAMDSVTRVAMLRKRISMFENSSDFSRDECAWLFALCAIVDTPLDADTCASLRCLLRSCGKLRARKSEVDDEVIMLNVLTTISGRFFGQSGKMM
ncbi:uncharacterized protein LOC104907990 isoform X2 [Beta vulgaris subsp. vulgaris]|uniref:uncharacterized protein LOC104907990 isoform X2 n=1 Tax=Beta vulgaris subsp. vulgaris TaxID=3555 RepID=UPI00053F6912|nr:uncharacterized protein LOC104907990 isoform X2 [Beta vulgaris subsp. vulgaris]